MLITNGTYKSHFYAFQKATWWERGNLENAKSLKCREYENFKQALLSMSCRSTVLMEHVTVTKKRSCLFPVCSCTTSRVFSGLSHTLPISPLALAGPASRLRPLPSSFTLCSGVAWMFSALILVATLRGSLSPRLLWKNVTAEQNVLYSWQQLLCVCALALFL